MKTTIPHILSGYGTEFFVCDGAAMLTKNRSVLDLSQMDAEVKSSLKDFAFSCPQRKDAYTTMAGNDEMAQLAQCVKCMFANFDGTPDLNGGDLIPEYVECGKRHYCAHVGVGCLPTKKAIELSDRENSLLPYLHLPNDQIAEKLFISIHTVKTHLRKIGKKLNLSKKPAMVKWASENVLIN